MAFGEIDSNVQDVTAGDRIREQDALQAKRSPLYGALKAAWNSESVTQALIDRYHGPEFQVDPDFRLDPAWIADQQKKRNIPAEFLPAFEHAVSQGHADRIAEQVEQELKDREAITSAGWTGAGASLAVGVFDPVSFVANTMTGGTTGLLSRGTRLARFIKAGSVAAGANMSLEAYLQAQQHIRDPWDIPVAGLVGFALGGLGGALTTTEADALRHFAKGGANEIQIKRLKEDGFEVTPKGQQELKTATGEYVPDKQDTSFGPGSVGAAQIAGTTFDEAGESAFVKVGKWNIPLRYDYYAKLAGSANVHIRNFAAKFLADGVGSKHGDENLMNVTEFAALDRQASRGEFYLAYHGAFDEWAKEHKFNLFRRVQNEQHFAEEVTAAIRGDPNVSVQAQKAAQATRKVLADYARKLKEAGVDGAEQLEADPNYILRRHNHDAIRQMDRDYGRETINDMVARAFRAARPDLEPEKAAKYADGYMTVVRGLQYRTDIHKPRVTDGDRAAIRTQLKRSGLEEDEINDVMEALWMRDEMKKAEGDQPRLKFRAKLDENFGMTVDGKTIRIKDMFVNDARFLMDVYTKQASGMLGLAKMGFRSDADIEALFKQASEEAQKIGQHGEQFQKELAHMRDIVDHVRGRPMSNEVHGTAERWARVLRDVNFFRMMGQAGFAQVAEIGNLMGLAGLRAMRAQMPSLGEVFKLAKLGKIDDQLGRDLVNLGGFGTEIVSHHSGIRELSELAYAPGLTKTEQYARMAAHATANFSGMRSVNNVLKSLASRAFVQRMADIAHGSTKLTDNLKRMLATDGLSEAQLDKVLEHVKKYSTVEGKTQRVTGIAWEEWARQSPKTYDLYRMAIFRQVNRAIQEQTIGETAPWMHSTLGKVLTQFRSFSLAAYNKQFLYGMAHGGVANPDIAIAWFASMMFGGMAYSAQTAMNYAHNDERREELLSPEKIAAAAFQRAGFSSILPGVYDSVAGTLWDGQLFSHGRTTGLAAGIAGIPTVDLGTKVLTTLSTASQALTTSDHMTTQKDMRNMLGLISNTWFIRNAVDAAASDMPKSNYLRQQAP